MFADRGYGSDFRGGLAHYQRRNELVFVERDGKERFRIAAAEASDFSEGLLAFAAHGKRGMGMFPGLWGFLDAKGGIAIPPKFADAGPFREGLARAVVDGYCRILSPTGRAKGSPTSGFRTSCGEAPEDAVAVCPVGFVDRKGEFAIEARFEAARDFAEGLAAVREGGKWGFIDPRGAWAIRPQFAQAHSFAEGLAAVLVGKKWGFIDTAGTMQIPATLGYEPEDFSGGYTTVGRQSYLDREGRQALGPFLEATPFVHGLAAVRRGKGEVEYINPRGQTIFRYYSRW